MLVSGIDSDLPGPILAQVSENVFDSATGQRLLIPQGSRLIGAYESAARYGQQRVQIASAFAARPARGHRPLFHSHCRECSSAAIPAPEIAATQSCPA